MGKAYRAKCGACQHTFWATDGGGFCFESVRCERCGQDRSVPRDNIRGMDFAYVKGQDFPMEELDRSDRRMIPGQPITKEEFRRRVVAAAGVCECGGRFSFDAPLRCPACRSTDVEGDHRHIILFD